MANRWGNNGNSDRPFLWAPKSLHISLQMKLKDSRSLEEKFFGHLTRITYSFEKTLMLRKIEGSKKSRVTEDKMVGWHH